MSEPVNPDTPDARTAMVERLADLLRQVAKGMKARHWFAPSAEKVARWLYDHGVRLPDERQENAGRAGVDKEGSGGAMLAGEQAPATSSPASSPRPVALCPVREAAERLLFDDTHSPAYNEMRLRRALEIPCPSAAPEPSETLVGFKLLTDASLPEDVIVVRHPDGREQRFKFGPAAPSGEPIP